MCHFDLYLMHTSDGVCLIAARAVLTAADSLSSIILVSPISLKLKLAKHKLTCAIHMDCVCWIDARAVLTAADSLFSSDITKTLEYEMCSTDYC